MAAFTRYLHRRDPGRRDDAGTEDPAVTQRRNEQKALVDILKGDLAKIRTRVGAADYQKIDAHLEGVLAMERRLTPTIRRRRHRGLHARHGADEGHVEQRRVPGAGHQHDGHHRARVRV